MGNELIPDVIDRPPLYPLDLTYKTIRTFPGMRLTADMTRWVLSQQREGNEVAALKSKLFRFKPMLKWPAQPDSLYTVVMSNLDINSRRNRLEQCIYNGENTLMIDLSPLQNIIRVLALVCCQHSRRLGGWRRGYLWASLPACPAWGWRRPQIRILCVRAARPAGLQGRGGSHRLLLSANVKRTRTFQVGVSPVASWLSWCSSFSRSTKNFMKKYNLELTAATFLILDSNEASMEVKLCEAREARL